MMPYTYADIKPGLSNYRAVEIRKTRNPNGSWHREYRGTTYYKTPIREMSEEEWEAAAEKIVEEQGDGHLLKAIEEHVRKNCVWLKKNEIRGYSLKCLVLKAYETWKEKGEFSFPDD